MQVIRVGLIGVLGIALMPGVSSAGDRPGSTDADLAPWNYAPCDEECEGDEVPYVPPMLGDQLQGGFNFNQGFQGFNQFNQGFQGFNQFNQGFQGFQQGFQGFQQGFQGFQQGFNQGFQGFNQGFQAGFNQGFQGFNQGFPIVVARGAEKMSENDSPRPQDRVFGNYNYYNNVRKVIDVHRETVGFEKTFLNGNASIGLRLPFFQDVAPGFSEGDPGDLSIRLKYAWINDPGTVISTGLAITTPTGPIPTVAFLQSDGSL
jgi:hypothetical protein